MYEFYIDCLIFIWKAFYLYRTSTSRTSAIKSFFRIFSFSFVSSSIESLLSEMLAFALAFFSLSYIFILIRIIEHRKPSRKPCHSRGLDLPLIQDGRAYPTTTQSKKILRSRMNARSNSASKNSICSTKLTAQIRDQIRHDIQKKHNQFRKSNLFLSIFLMTIIEDHHSFNRRKSRRNSWSNHEKQLFSDIHEWQWHKK